ncbi:hypothetical protein [Legionella santicrucis]|nr:hypothetical protein [Legionella santicrucis]
MFFEYRAITANYGNDAIGTVTTHKLLIYLHGLERAVKVAGSSNEKA